MTFLWAMMWDLEQSSVPEDLRPKQLFVPPWDGETETP